MNHFVTSDEDLEGIFHQLSDIINVKLFILIPILLFTLL